MCLCLGACIVKYILIGINLILTIVGLAITALGVIALVKVRSIETAESHLLEDLTLFSSLIIVVGCIVTLIFFLGCCGVISRNVCMLKTYSGIIVILATLTVGLTVYISKNKETVTDSFTDELSGVLNQTDATALSALETFLECCGTTGPDYYDPSSLPVSCCPALSNIQNIQIVQQHADFSSIANDININTGEGVLCNINDAFEVGCVTQLAETLKHILKSVVTVLILICIAEYVVAVMAILYTCYIRRKK